MNEITGIAMKAMHDERWVRERQSRGLARSGSKRNNGRVTRHWWRRRDA